MRRRVTFSALLEVSERKCFFRKYYRTNASDRPNPQLPTSFIVFVPYESTVIPSFTSITEASEIRGEADTRVPGKRPVRVLGDVLRQ